MQPSQPFLPSFSIPLLAALSLLGITSGACNFPEKSFLPDDEFNVVDPGEGGEGGEGGKIQGGAGQGGKIQGGAGQGGEAQGGAGQGGEAQGGAGQGGDEPGGAGQGGDEPGGAGQGGDAAGAGQGGEPFGGGGAGGDTAGAGQGGEPFGGGGAGGDTAGAGQGGAGQGGISQGGAGQGGAGQGGEAQGGEGGAGQGGCNAGDLGKICKSSSECQCGQVCSAIDYDQVHINCQTPKASGKNAGETCLGNGQCLSNFCDGFSKTCSLGCQSSSECGSGNICGRTYFSQTQYFDQCFKECQRDSDCPMNAGGKAPICMLKEDFDADIRIFACAYLGRDAGDALDGGGVVRGFAEKMGPNDGCYSGLPLANDYCSKACASNSDCGGALPNCGIINAPPPSNIGTIQIKGCVPLFCEISLELWALLDRCAASREKLPMAHAEHDHDDHDDHEEAHEEHHEPPPPKEPESPWWLPLLGAALFLVGGISFFVLNAEDPGEKKAAAEVQKVEKPAVTAAAPTPPPAIRPALTAIPALRKALEERRQLKE